MSATNEYQKRYRRTRNGTINDRMYGAKRRAKLKEWDYDLSLEALIEIWETQQGLCALSGVELGYIGSEWNVASLDRIEPTKGYTVDNIQWIAWRVNDAKSNMTNQDFISMCTAITATFIKGLKCN